MESLKLFNTLGFPNSVLFVTAISNSGSGTGLEFLFAAVLNLNLDQTRCLQMNHGNRYPAIDKLQVCQDSKFWLTLFQYSVSGKSVVWSVISFRRGSNTKLSQHISSLDHFIIPLFPCVGVQRIQL